MNFWERVDELLEEKEINRKTLAAEAGFDASNITKGIKNANIPAADTAVKIAGILNVSVEYLVTGSYTPSATEDSIAKKMRLFRKYRALISGMEMLSENNRKAVELLVAKLASASPNEESR